MIRNLDIRLEKAIDEMKQQRIDGTGPQVFTGHKAFQEKSCWLLEICRIATEFSNLADPDALAAIPALDAVFRKKSAEVAALDISEKLIDDIEYEISIRRKQIGIDKRLRDLTRGKSSSDGEW